MTDLLDSGKVKFEVDPKYAQALGITNVINALRIFGNCAWDIIQNEHAGSPFFTSDYPVGIEVSEDPRVINRIVPLSPTLAIRIRPDINLDRKACDESFSHFRSRYVKADHRLVAYINQIIVRSAETTVFYREDLPWVVRFVTNNRNFRIELRIHTLRHRTSETSIYQPRIAAPKLDDG